MILTTSNEEQDIAAGYDLGVNSYIRKPVDFQQFAHVVEQLTLYWLLLNEPPPAGAKEASGQMNRLRILQVEDLPSDAALTEGALIRAGYTVYSERVATAPEMRAALAKQPWDLIVADYLLSEFDAKSALSLLHQSGHDIPFIVVSGTLGEELAVAMMKAGAQDYLLKRDLARLAPAVEREIGDVRARRGRK